MHSKVTNRSWFSVWKPEVVTSFGIRIEQGSSDSWLVPRHAFEFQSMDALLLDADSGTVGLRVLAMLGGRGRCML